MKLTVKIMLLGFEAELRQLMSTFNAACNEVAKIAFETKTFTHRKLRGLVYKDLTKRIGSTHADLVAKHVACMYAERKQRAKLIQFKGAAVILDKRSLRYTRDGCASIRVIGRRVRVPFSVRPGTILSNRHEAKILMDGKRIVLHQAIDVPEAIQAASEGWLGVDLGVVNIATDSDGTVFSGKHINGLRRRYARVRSRLQSKGTASAKRLKRKRQRKESRFTRNVSHAIAKKLVTKACDSRRGIALEDLKGIMSRIKVRHAQRGSLHTWAFTRLRKFVEYKARLAGVEVRLVDPRNTSRTCPECGHVDKKNRPSQAVFKCVRCGCAGHADHFAARNIASRAAGFQPNAVLVTATAAGG